MINQLAKLYNKDYPLIFLFLIGFCSFGLLKIPFFLADFWFSKWVVAYILTVCLSFWVGLQDKEILLPFFPTLWGLGIGILLLLLIYNHYSHQLPFLSQAFWDRLSFFLLTISFYNFFKRDPFFIKKILASLFIANALFLLVNLPSFYLFILQGAQDPTLLYGSFGNINMSAEFVGTCLILMIISRSYFPFSKRLIDTFIFLSIVYCSYAFCRSIIIAVIIPLTIIAFKNCSLKKALKCIGGGCLLIVILILAAKIFLKINFITDFSLLLSFYQKSSSDIARWQIIKATWELIKDHPWGIGAGNYIFSLIPYFSYLMPPFNEKEIVQSPHNEYLRLLAEEGWLFTLIVVLWISSYLFYFRQQINTLFNLNNA